MQVRPHGKPMQVIGPFGEALTLADLPQNNTTRWVIRRKAEVVAAVNGGLLSLQEACARYNLSLEEFYSWQETIDKSGLPGLRVSHLSQYRTASRTSQEELDQPGAHPLEDSHSNLH